MLGNNMDKYRRKLSRRNPRCRKSTHKPTVVETKTPQKPTVIKTPQKPTKPTPRPSITCVLTVFNRPEYFKRQITAIQKQNYPPTNIIIWHNGEQTFDYSGSDMVIHCRPNVGVWSRFYFCLALHTDFVCVFDDDTIPGVGWLRSCLNEMQKQEGLYGAHGIRFPKQGRHPSKRFGWVNPNPSTMRVDIVGHSWFFRPQWIRYFAFEPRPQRYSTCGEDYHLSVSLQRHGLHTYVPPHPKDNKTIWGSIKGTFGYDQKALSRIPAEEHKKLRVHNDYRNGGWKLVSDHLV
jgi:hypothetical protein